MRRRLLLVVLAIAGCQVALGQNQAPELPSGWTPKQPVTTRRDMVAAANPLAVAAGTSIFDDSSGVHAIVRTQSGWIGGADPRREATVAGD